MVTNTCHHIGSQWVVGWNSSHQVFVASIFYLTGHLWPWILLFDTAQSDLELLYSLTPASAAYVSPLLFKTQTDIIKVLTKLHKLTWNSLCSLFLEIL